MANRKIGQNFYFRSLVEIEREIREHGNFAFTRVSQVAGVDPRTVKGFYEVGLRAIPTRNMPGMPAIKDVIEGKVPRPEGAPPVAAVEQVSDRTFDVPIRIPSHTPVRFTLPGEQALPAPPPIPEPSVPAPPPLPEPPPLPDLPMMPESFQEEPPAPSPEPSQESFQVPPAAPPAVSVAPEPPQAVASPAERESLVTTIIRESERYIESREFQSMAVKHVRGGVQALEAAQNAALGINVMCQKLLHAIEPAFDRLAYDVQVRLKDGERIPVKELSDALTAIAKAAQASGTELKSVLESKQLLLGGPTEIVRQVSQGAPVQGAQQRSDPSTDALVTGLLQGRLFGAAPVAQADDGVIDVASEPSEEASEESE